MIKKEKSKLEILDLSKLKITKAKPWAIYFTYNETRYLLHGRGDCGEDSVTLYKRIPINNNGNFKLEYMNGIWDDEYLLWEYIKPTKTLVYNQIDKDYFVKQLISKGFAIGNSEIEKSLGNIQCKNKEREELIKELRNKIYELEKQIRNLEE